MKSFMRNLSAFLGVGVLMTSLASGATSGTLTTITNNTPKFTASAKSVGAVDPTSTIEVSVWLKPHNKADMDALAKDLYDPSSANFRKWLTPADIAKRYAPTADEAKTVQDFLTTNKLSVVKVGPNNFFVRARGTVAAVNSAFHVTLNNYQVNGKTIRGNAKDPAIAGEAGALVSSVAGLDTLEYTHPALSKAALMAPKPGSAAKMAAVPNAASAVGTSLPFDPVCFEGKRTENFLNQGSLPAATYTGVGYTTNTAGCGYTPENIYTAYDMKKLFAEHLDGTGQTIVILDWCGSPTITADANAFSAQFGLPKLTSSNFKIIYTPSPSYCSAPDVEINIDVEWAHAIAPGAAIDLVVPPSASFQDVDQAYFYAVNYQLGNVISGSFGSEELYTPTTVLLTEDLISETAAILGISANFSTGDEGDYTFDFPEFDPASVIAPADSPYATGVGGISLSLNAAGGGIWQTGWGNNINYLDDEGYVTTDPTTSGFFYGGSGGGRSGFFAKPAYQSKLSGSGRHLPDISWLADPFTGAYIAISEPGVLPSLQYQVWGGTSLACPMFSALWAIANQAAGVPLGQAAPYMYSMPASTITDILPYSSANDVTGKVEDTTGKKTAYTAAQLAQPLDGTGKFLSVLYDVPLYEDTTVLLTFGTDSGLKTGPGWDDVTGVGVPSPPAFVGYFKP